MLVLALAVVGGVAWALVRYARARSFEKLGWRFERDPGEVSVWGLNRPPFGRGRGRLVRELVRGEAAGIGFRAVRYESASDRPPGFVVALPLARPLPPLVAGDPAAFPPEPLGVPVAGPAGVAVLADDPGWGRAVATGLASELVGWAGGRQAFSVDGATLVGLGCRDEPEALTAFVPRLATVAAALERLDSVGIAVPPVPLEMGLVHHPDWVYRTRDDAMLGHVAHNRGGSDHEAHDVMFEASPEVGFIALTHRWTTTRIVSTGQGQTRTRTDHHSEDLAEITLGFPFVDLSVNKMLDVGRERVRFESDDFNRDFSVRCHDPRFASLVFHPRQMEFLQHARPPSFAIENRHIVVDWDGRVRTIEWWLEFADGFFGRVPAFVWKDLGIDPPALTRRWLV